MRSVGISDQEIDDIKRILSAVLWIGEITFNNTEPVSIANHEPIRIVAGTCAVFALLCSTPFAPKEVLCRFLKCVDSIVVFLSSTARDRIECRVID